MPDFLKRIINGPIVSTVIRNFLIFVGGFVVAKEWMSPDEWSTVSAALGSLLLTLWAVIEARRNKIVFNGQRETLPKTPYSAVNKAKTVIEESTK